MIPGNGGKISVHRSSASRTPIRPGAVPTGDGLRSDVIAPPISIHHHQIPITFFRRAQMHRRTVDRSILLLFPLLFASLFGFVDGEGGSLAQ